MPPKPNEIHLVRRYDAPVAAVWAAWTDPAQVAQWWGPRGFTLTTHAKDLRPGGHWTYTMHGPDGVNYPNKTIYHEVATERKLVYDHGGNDDRPPLFRVTALFRSDGGGTVLDMTMALASPEAATEIKRFIKKAGGDATWDRLAEYLDGRRGRSVFVINRAYDATPERLYALWTTPEHLRRWLPPVGFLMDWNVVDLRPGGTSSYSMSGPGLTLYGEITYVSMESPRRLVYVQRFLDKEGRISRHPLAPVWPEAMRTTVRFEEEEPGRARVTVLWEPEGSATVEEVAAFLQERPGMTVGWTGSLDKLEELLAGGFGN
jgi:uncharacterized protein YndB with AHSA1/START domain